MRGKIFLLLLLCGSNAAKKVREDEASRFDRFMTALSACSPSGANRWPVVCALEQVYPAEIHVELTYALDVQVETYLLDELSQPTAARRAGLPEGAQISSNDFKALSANVRLPHRITNHRCRMAQCEHLSLMPPYAWLGLPGLVPCACNW